MPEPSCPEKLPRTDPARRRKIELGRAEYVVSHSRGATLRGRDDCATTAPPVFARHVGAPVIHGAHAGEFSCPFPATPLTYRGHCEGGAQVCDASGKVLAFRGRSEGNGAAIADVQTGRSPGVPVPDKFWFQDRGAIGAFGWAYQNAHGRRVYNRLPKPTPATPEPTTPPT